jgi:two-component system chemotaxis sensor kinase CheA
MEDFDLTQFHQTFFDEAQEHLDEMERLLLAVDVHAPGAEELNAIFRAAHSIKGGSGTFGFNDMAELTHVLESLLDKVRNSEMALSNDIVEASLQAGDVIRKQLQGHREGFDVAPDEAVTIKATLTALLQRQAPVAPPAAGRAHAPDHEGQAWQVRCQLDKLGDRTRDALFDELRRLGIVTVAEPRGDGAPDLIQIFLDDGQSRHEVDEIFAFVAQPDEYAITPWVLENTSTPTSPPPPQDELDGDGFGFFTDPISAPAVTETPPEDGEGYGFFEPVTPPTPSAEPVVVATNKEAPARRAADKENETSIRVNIDKVDQLINLVGELVITQAMLAQTVSTFDPVQNESLFNGMGLLERNSRNLQEAVMSIRMLPINAVFSRFPRVVRDIANKFGKQVELKLVGEHTELDKGLIEKLSDPLTHLVRNSLDHGIETPEVRLAAGKPAKGTLILQASQQGGSIVVQVIDDGAGLNRARILAKAQERGLPISADAPDHEVWQLIFAPGFSTAETITDVSGRGVGMDVVKRNIEGMGGRVEITTTPGAGTRITIRLPLTLAILDGMYIGVGTQVFILPLNLIVESLQPRAAEISTISGKGRVVHVRGEYLPLLMLYEVFNITPQTSDPTQGIVVILELEGGKTALFVDQLLGQHQVVIKSLETNYRKVAGVSGATIMGDGRVALILDVPSLVQLGRN